MKFRVQLFRGTGDDVQRDDPEQDYEFEGDWTEHRHLRAEGFDSWYDIDVGSVWQDLLDSGADRAEGVVPGYETIFKFGEQRQLAKTFTVELTRLGE